jgi:hypothetical protein
MEALPAPRIKKAIDEAPNWIANCLEMGSWSYVFNPLRTPKSAEK